MSDLPPDLITVVLCRLPVKTLLRFRCVSKRWRSLIDGAVFINMHLELSIQNKNNHGLVLGYSSKLYFVDFEAINAVVELNHPLMCYGNRINVLGSSNGLICLCNVAEDIALWNLSTKRYRILPGLPLNRERRDFGMCLCTVSAYGFGFDYVNCDYKVVRIMQIFGVNCEYFESEVKVYSMLRNEWTRIQDMPYVLLHTKRGALAGGALHWVVAHKNEVNTANLVVAFDLALENYQEVLLPVYADDKFDMNLGILGGCLCITANCGDAGVDVWVMKEYGAKESWTKLFSIVQAEVISSFGYVSPLIYSKNGREVLLEQNKNMLLWYNLENETVKNAWIDGMPDSFDALVCLGSLVPVDPSKIIGKKKPVREDLKKRDDFLSQGFKLVL